MLGVLTVTKILLSIFIVIALAEISKRANPQIAGIIAGLPLGTGLSIYFISLEQGVEFAITGVPWGIAGLSGSLLFCLVYLLVSRLKVTKNRIITILLSSMIGVLAFLFLGYIISLFKLNLLIASFIFLFIFTVNLLLVNKIIGRQLEKTSTRSTYKQHILRGVVVGGILLLITGLAPIVGSTWANILSSFPSTLFPLLVILHFEEDDRLFPYVIYGFSYSITTLYVFYLLYTYVVPKFDLNLGFLLIYILCGCYLIVFQKMKSFIKEYKKEWKKV